MSAMLNEPGEGNAPAPIESGNNDGPTDGSLDTLTAKTAAIDEEKPRAASVSMQRRQIDVAMAPGSLDEQARTVDAVLSTGAAVRRNDWRDGEYDEVLDMQPSSIRLDRLNAGAPLLDSHDYGGGTGAILGAVVPGTAHVEGGRLKAKFKFSRSEAGDRAFQDVKDGVLRHVSVGYLTHQFVTDNTRTPAVRTATDWEPHECSAVQMPADPGAGFRASTASRLSQRAEPANERIVNMPQTAAAAAPANELDSATRSQIDQGVRAGIKAEQERRDQIADAARKLGLPEELANEHIRKETSAEHFRALAIEEAAKRAPVTDAVNPWPGAPALVRNKRREPEKGEMAARFVRAIAAGKRIGVSPMEVAGRMWGDDLLARAMAAGIGASGGFLVPEEYSAEVIELLRPIAVVRSMNPVILPMPGGNTTTPKLTGGANAHYVGENADITAADPQLGTLRLTARKLAAIVPISNDLLRFSSPQADAVVRDDMVAAIAIAEDQTFIRGPGSDFSPKGLRNWALSSSLIAANATVSLANTITDLNKLVNALETANVRMLRPGWLFGPRTKNYLNTLTSAQGAFVFRDEMNGGKLLGFPFRSTNNIPQNLGGGGDDSEIYLVDFADAVIGEVPGLIIDVSQEASYTVDGTNFTSAFSQDQTVIRVIEQHDFGMRHDPSVAVLTAVKWQ